MLRATGDLNYFWLIRPLSGLYRLYLNDISLIILLAFDKLHLYHFLRICCMIF